jgi:hypothetical protein
VLCIHLGDKKYEFGWKTCRKAATWKTKRTWEDNIQNDIGGEWEEGRIGSVSCPVACFGISGGENIRKLIVVSLFLTWIPDTWFVHPCSVSDGRLRIQYEKLSFRYVARSIEKFL